MSKSPSSIQSRASGGFMLIEVLVSVLIFSVGVLAVIGLQATMSRAQAASKDRADAANLATEIIGVMWADAGSITSYNGTACASYGRCADWANKVTKELPRGSSTLAVALVTGETSVYDVNVTITWVLPDGGKHTYTTQTTVSRNPT